MNTKFVGYSTFFSVFTPLNRIALTRCVNGMTPVSPILFPLCADIFYKCGFLVAVDQHKPEVGGYYPVNCAFHWIGSK